MNEKKVVIYTDGACRGNGKTENVGGYGIVLMYGDARKEFKKAFRNTTNNKMELTAVIDALKLLKSPCIVELYTDSSYVVNAFRQNWVANWMKNSWTTSNREPVKNKELWLELLNLMKVHSVKYNHVKGHALNVENNRCDKLANDAMNELINR